MCAPAAGSATLGAGGLSGGGRRRAGGGPFCAPRPQSHRAPCGARLITVSCASRRSPCLRGDEHRPRQHRHGFRSQHGECRPLRGCPRPLPALRAHSVHSAGPEAFSARRAAPCTRRARAGGVVGVAAVQRAHPSCGRKGSWAGLSARPGTPPFSSALSPGPEASQVPPASLATGAGEPGREVSCGGGS